MHDLKYLTKKRYCNLTGNVKIFFNPPHIEYFYKGELGRKMRDSIEERDFRLCMAIVEEYLALLN